jgi:[acyl-carrier-protein] S-malonyltransferase
MSKGFLFPGYGSQYVGMGKDLYDNYRVVQEVFEEASQCLGINFVRLCFASSERELSKTLHAYLSIFVVHASFFEVLQLHGVEPSLIVGWGVGFVTANYSAGIINFPDCLYILKKYITFFNELVGSEPVALLKVHGMPISILEDYLHREGIQGHVVLGIIHDVDNSTVIGGKESIVKLHALLKDKAQATIIPDPVSNGLHMLFRQEMVNRMNMYLAKIDCKAARYNMINQDGVKIKVGEQPSLDALTRFMYRPINIPQVVAHLQTCDSIIQVGYHKITLAVIQRYFLGKEVKMFYQQKSLKDIKDVG